jgi:cell wall-associated NlpC family hydrolase
MNQADRERVIAEAKTWIGTPWHHEARVKGAGVDCVMLLCEVYERAGVLSHVVPDHYSPDVMLHRGHEVVLPYLENYGFEVESPEIGDVVVYHFARSYSHAGIYVGNAEIIHAYRPMRGVVRTSMDDGRLMDRARKFYTMRGL